MADKLKPCPFCGCKEIDVMGGYEDFYEDFQPHLYYCECEDCRATSGLTVERKDAIKKWNARKEEK